MPKPFNIELLTGIGFGNPPGTGPLLGSVPTKLLMPRLPRSQLCIHTYFHVCAKGNNGRSLFLDDVDRNHYIFLIEKYRDRYNLQCLAYCLMTNHVHLLFLCPSIKNLSKTMHDLQVAYVVYFNRRHMQRGHLFESRFTSWVIKDEGHLLATKKYIEENPVKAGIIQEKENYRWSSATRDRSLVTISEIST